MIRERAEMAMLHPETGNLVLHVVYDGIPRSGKTESVRALARCFDRSAQTFEERDGRTLYFDWLDLEGGRLLDRPIHYRVLSVPGQKVLSRRRSMIIAAADVVIFVLDSSTTGFAGSLERLTTLRRQLKSRHRPIPILVQANKQDLPEAVDLGKIRDRIGADLQIFSTIATEGRGIREAFVLSVGMCIRYLRKESLVDLDRLARDTGESSLPNAKQLLSILSDIHHHGD